MFFSFSILIVQANKASRPTETLNKEKKNTKTNDNKATKSIPTKREKKKKEIHIDLNSKKRKIADVIQPKIKRVKMYE